jgi:hypothetical protein
VALGDRVVDVVGELGATDDMAPVDAYPVASLDVDDFARNGGFEPRVASNVTIVHILDRVVGGGGADADELAVVVAVDPRESWFLPEAIVARHCFSPNTLCNGVGRRQNR